MSEEKKEESGYQGYLRRKNSSKEKAYVRLNEKGKTEYMKFVRKAYQMMLFWVGFGGLMSYLSYSLAPHIRFLRNRNSFRTIRLGLAVVPLAVFSYHGIKFMLYYKDKGAREVSRDASNIITEEEYQRKVEAQSTVKAAL